MFEFQLVIAEMQLKINEAKQKGTDTTESEARVDKLIEIYSGFDKFYYSAHFNEQKILQLKKENHDLYDKLIEATKENEKLLATIEWK